MHDLKMQDWKMTDNFARNRRAWKMQDWKMTDNILAKLWAKLRGLENAGLENDGQNFSKLWAKLRGLENAGLENDGPC